MISNGWIRGDRITKSGCYILYNINTGICYVVQIDNTEKAKQIIRINDDDSSWHNYNSKITDYFIPLPEPESYYNKNTGILHCNNWARNKSHLEFKDKAFAEFALSGNKILFRGMFSGFISPGEWVDIVRLNLSTKMIKLLYETFFMENKTCG